MSKELKSKNHCEQADGDCEAPAGIGIRNGYKRMPRKSIPFCDECGKPVCEKCSEKVDGADRMCNDCNPRTDTGYEKIVRSIEEAPDTWSGGLMLAAVQACVRKKFFKDRNALLKVVKNVLKGEPK